MQELDLLLNKKKSPLLIKLFKIKKGTFERDSLGKNFV